MAKSSGGAGRTSGMNTAQLRNAARDAEGRADFATAARLLSSAIKKYPASTGEMARIDIAKLRARVKENRDAARMMRNG